MKKLKKRENNNKNETNKDKMMTLLKTKEKNSMTQHDTTRLDTTFL